MASGENVLRAWATAEIPIFFKVSGLCSNWFIALMISDLFLFVMTPVWLWMMTSAVLPTLVAMTGRPANCASISATGMPSFSEVERIKSQALRKVAASTQPKTFAFSGALFLS